MSYSIAEINEFIETGLSASDSDSKGSALENLTEYLFSRIPGVIVESKDITNFAVSEEIDIALWNDKEPNGLNHFPNIIFIECKYLNRSMSSNEVSSFIDKLVNRSLDFGIIVASKGISGTRENIRHAYQKINAALIRGIKIIIITFDDILALTDSSSLVKLVKKKFLRLHLRGA